MSNFDALPLRPALREALAAIGYIEATPIQALALPPALEGRDVLGLAQTGSGKTAAFGLAMLQAIDPAQRSPQALTIAPTRELAEQITDELRRLARRTPDVRVLTLCGGRDRLAQRRALGGGAQLVVGTPGRLLDHLSTGALDPSGLRSVTLDEADRLLELGFIEQIQAILERLPARRQTLLFSATFPPPLRALSGAFQRSPVEVTAPVGPPPALRQSLVSCEPGARLEALIALLASLEPSRALIFCETRRGCAEVAEALREAGADAVALHGDLNQRDRGDALAMLSGGSVRALVATDVAARGLDIDDLDLVINLAVPAPPETYLHRVGRAGRAGRAGQAVTLCGGERDRARLEAIEAALDGPLATLDRAPPHATAGPPLAGLQAPWRTVLVLGGRRDKLRPGDVLGALTHGTPEIPGDAVGRIQLDEGRCYVSVRAALARQAMNKLRRGPIKRRRFRATLLGERR